MAVRSPESSQTSTDTSNHSTDGWRSSGSSNLKTPARATATACSHPDRPKSMLATAPSDPHDRALAPQLSTAPRRAPISTTREAGAWIRTLAATVVFTAAEAALALMPSASRAVVTDHSPLAALARSAARTTAAAPGQGLTLANVSAAGSSLVAVGSDALLAASSEPARWTVRSTLRATRCAGSCGRGVAESWSALAARS